MFFNTRRTGLILLATIAAVMVPLLPALLVSHFPLVDYPNHLGRYQIYKTLAHSPALAKFYEWHWAIIPNLAMDILVVPVSYILPIEQSANMLVLLAMVSLCLGTIALDRKLHGPRWGLSLFVGLLLYNGAFRYGFVNYIVGVSFALPAFAAWVHFRPQWSAWTAAAFSVVGAFLMIMHLFGFALYAVCVAGYEFSLLLDDARQGGRWRMPRLRVPLEVAVSVALPLGLLALSPTSGQAGVTRWSTPLWKLEALISPIFFNHPYIEIPLIGVLLGLLAAGLASGTLRLHRRMFWPMVAFAVLVLVMPRTLFGSNYADYRLPGGVGFFLLASLELDIERRSWRHAVIGLLTICLLVRIGSIGRDWISVQPTLNEYETALSAVPPGSKVLVLQGDSASTSAARTPPLEHVPVFAGAKQQVFIAYLFTGKAVPVQFTPAYQDYFQFAPYASHAIEMGRYDYVLAMQDPVFEVPAGLKLTQIGSGRTYVLSRIDRR